MSMFRSININNKYFVGNGLQLCLQKVLVGNGINCLRIGWPSIGINCFQKREMAARRGKRIAASKEKQRLAKIKREEAKNVGPQVWIPHKLRIDKSTLNVGSRRFSDKDRKHLDLLVDNVYITELYKQMSYSLSEVIALHRETHQSSLFNEPNAIIESTIELDLRTKKKTRFCEAFKNIISYPNKFEFKVNRRIIAICKKEEDKMDAKEAGADVVGGTEIIKMLQKGELNMSNFDDLVCHGDLLVELANIKGLLLQSFPSKLKGNLGFDMKKLVTQFVNGIDYKCVKDEFELDFGWVRVPFGRLDMTDAQLEQNFRYLLSTIEKHKPVLAIVPFITRVLLQSEPSKEEFAVKFWNYTQGYEEPNNSDENEDNVETSKEKDSNLSTL